MGVHQNRASRFAGALSFLEILKPSPNSKLRLQKEGDHTGPCVVIGQANQGKKGGKAEGTPIQGQTLSGARILGQFEPCQAQLEVNQVAGDLR